MSHEFKSLKQIEIEHKEVRKKALCRTAKALKTIRKQREIAVDYDRRYVGELEIAERGAEDAMLHLAIVSAAGEEDEIARILSAHGVGDILP